METFTEDQKIRSAAEQKHILKLLHRVAAQAGYSSVKAFVLAAAVKEARKIIIHEKLMRLHQLNAEKVTRLKKRIDAVKAL